MDFGSNLYHLRTERGINQRDLASELQVSTGTISNYENNVHFPNPELLCQIAYFFHVSTDYLLGRTQYRSTIEDLELPINGKYTMEYIMELLLRLSEEDCQNLLQYMHMLEIHG
ncbi:MAG: helix-turn-helix domain-containing protein [Acetatifactor sp.]|nr:helix-turn-helix domain-containing protein [Acetatifactor sp.]